MASENKITMWLRAKRSNLLKVCFGIIALFCLSVPAHAGYMPFNTVAAGNIGIGTASPTGFEIEGRNVGIGTAFTTTSALTVMNGNVGIGTWVPNGLFAVGNNAFNVSSGGTVTIGSAGSGTLTNPGSGVSSERFGVSASTGSASQAIAIGDSASVGSIGGAQQIAIGYASTATGSSSIAIGFQANANNFSAVFGPNAASTAADQIVFGANNAALNNLYIGNGVTNASPVAVSFNGVGGSGSNIQGGNLAINAGPGTGTGAGGVLTFQTAPAGASSSNLNNLSERMRVDTKGNVGIGSWGSNTIGNGLSVVGNIGIGTGTSSNFVLNAAPNGGMIVQGNVGIGSLTPGQALDVTGTIRTTGLTMSGAAPAANYVLTSTDSAGDTAWTAPGNVAAAGWTQTGTNVYTPGTNNVGVGTSTPQGAFVVTNGNVGIGTWAPGAALYVNGGNIGVGTVNTTLQPLDVYGTAYFGKPGSGYSNRASISDDASNNSYFSVNGGSYGLDVNGNGSVSLISQNTSLTFNAGDASASIVNILFQDNGTTVGGFYGQTSSTSIFNVNGNVGFGTAAPTGKLEIEGGNVGIGTWTAPDGGSNNTIHWGNVGIGTSKVGGTGEGALTVMNGNVGIGTWLPDEQLQVIGSAIIGGANNGNQTIYAANNIEWEYSSSSNLRGEISGATGGGQDMGITAGYSGASGHIELNTNGSTIELLNSNVGIGTGGGLGGGANAVNSTLVVNGSVGIGTGNASSYEGNTAPSGGLIVQGNLGIGTWAPTNHEIEMNVGIGTAFTTAAGLSVMNGNVGIGTWVPAARMQVSGQYDSIRYNNGSTGGTVTIDWNNGNVQAITLTSSITSLTLNNPVAGGRYLVEIKQGTGGSFTVAWPSNVKWPGGTTPTLTTTAGQTDMITLYYNGTNYAAAPNLNYSL